jgi:hypothetical protein
MDGQSVVRACRPPHAAQWHEKQRTKTLLCAERVRSRTTQHPLLVRDLNKTSRCRENDKTCLSRSVLWFSAVRRPTVLSIVSQGRRNAVLSPTHTHIHARSLTCAHGWHSATPSTRSLHGGRDLLVSVAELSCVTHRHHVGVVGVGIALAAALLVDVLVGLLLAVLVVLVLVASSRQNRIPAKRALGVWPTRECGRASMLLFWSTPSRFQRSSMAISSTTMTMRTTMPALFSFARVRTQAEDLKSRPSPLSVSRLALVVALHAPFFTLPKQKIP